MNIFTTTFGGGLIRCVTAQTSRSFYVGALLLRTPDTPSWPVARKNVPTKDDPRKISLSERSRRVCVAAAISVGFLLALAQEDDISDVALCMPRRKQTNEIAHKNGAVCGRRSTNIELFLGPSDPSD